MARKKKTEVGDYEILPADSKHESKSELEETVAEGYSTDLIETDNPDEEEVDYDQARSLYIEGFVNHMDVHVYPTMTALVQKMQLSPLAIPKLRNLCETEGWNLLRAEYREKLQSAKRLRLLEKRSEEQAEFDNSCLKLANVGLKQVQLHFALSAKAQTPLTLKELQQASTALQKFQVVGRIALGDTTQDLQEKLDGGMDLESLGKEELAQLEAILAKAEQKAI